MKLSSSRIFPCLGILALLPVNVFAVTLRVVTYNIAADVDGYTAARPGLDTVLEAVGQQAVNDVVQPADVIALEETTSNDTTVAPLAATLNAYYAAAPLVFTPFYAAGSFQATEVRGDPSTGNGPNAVLYNTRTLTLVEAIGVGTPSGSSNGEYRQIARYQFQPVGGTGANAFYVYVSHMKSSASGTAAAVQAARALEAQMLRDDSATLPATAGVLYLGDFNLDGSSEAAYQTLTAPGAAQGIDPFNTNPQNNAEDWSKAIYTALATESATALHYRDDIQFVSSGVFNGTLSGGLHYLAGSYRTFGNNGTTGYLQRVDAAKNTALANLRGPITAAAALAALTTASDHLPVVADYTVDTFPPLVFPPEITSATTADAQAGALFTYQITASRNPTSFDATGLPPGLQVDPSTGLISGVPAQTGSFSVVLSATNANGSSRAVLTLNVTAAPVPAPVITSVTSVSIVQGASTWYQVTATNDPTIFTATGLPDGLSIDPAMGRITGAAAVAGVFNVALTAANNGGTGTATLTLTVNSAPTGTAPKITSSTAANAQVGTRFGYYITSDSTVAARYSVSGLPAGLSFDATGSIFGTPEVPGDYAVSLQATSVYGTGSATLNLKVAAAPLPVPVITSADSASAQLGRAFLYQITSDLPANYSADGLPPGLGVDAVSGLISGTPTRDGTYYALLHATNAGGVGTFRLVLGVASEPVVSFSVPGSANGKSATVAEGGPKLKILVVRTGDDLSQPLTVTYKATSSAASGADYKPLTGIVTIPAGSSSAKVKVRTYDDGVADGTKVLKLKLTPSTDGSYVLGDPAKAKVTILDVGGGQ